MLQALGSMMLTIIVLKIELRLLSLVLEEDRVTFLNLKGTYQDLECIPQITILEIMLQSFQLEENRMTATRTLHQVQLSTAQMKEQPNADHHKHILGEVQEEQKRLVIHQALDSTTNTIEETLHVLLLEAEVCPRASSFHRVQEHIMKTQTLSNPQMEMSSLAPANEMARLKMINQDQECILKTRKEWGKEVHNLHSVAKLNKKEQIKVQVQETMKI